MAYGMKACSARKRHIVIKGAEQDLDCLANHSRHGASRGLPYRDGHCLQPAGREPSFACSSLEFQILQEMKRRFVGYARHPGCLAYPHWIMSHGKTQALQNRFTRRCTASVYVLRLSVT